MVTLRWLLATMLLAVSGQAVAQDRWQVVRQPNGYAVAVVKLTGAHIKGIAITCERTVPVIAISLAQGPSVVPVTITNAQGRSYTIALQRNGASGVWTTKLADAGTLDALVAGGSSLTVANGPRDAITDDGAGEAMRALTQCYTPRPMIAAAPPPPAGRMAPPPTPGAAGGVNPVFRDAVAKVVRGLYASVANDKAPPPAYTPGYKALRDKCSATQTAYAKRFPKGDGGFGACGEDASPICQCQDMDEAVLMRSLQITVVEVSPGVARAAAKFRLFPNENFHTVYYRAVRTAAGWQIDDIVAPGRGKDISLDRSVLVEGINELSPKIGRPRISPPPLTQPVP
jgi:hypothetical protein